MPEYVTIGKDVDWGSFRCTAKRFDTKEEAEAIAAECDAVAQYEPPTPYYSAVPGAIGQVGQHDGGWLVRRGNSYIRCTSNRFK